MHDFQERCGRLVHSYMARTFASSTEQEIEKLLKQKDSENKRRLTELRRNCSTNTLGLGKCYQPQPPASADNSYLDLDYSGYHKNLLQ